MQLKTYSDWSKALDILESRENDRDVLAWMEQGTIEWQAGVAERFTRKFLNTINCRINYATDRFQKEMSRTRGQEREIVNALLLLRNQFNYLYKVCSVKALRKQERESFQKIVQDAADNVQKSLEDSARKSDRTGRLLHTITGNKVNRL